MEKIVGKKMTMEKMFVRHICFKKCFQKTILIPHPTGGKRRENVIAVVIQDYDFLTRISWWKIFNL